MVNEDETNKKAKDLENQIKLAKKELDEIQDNCLHKEYEIKPTGENGRELKRVCKSCKRQVGYPTKQETEDYMNK